MPQAISVNFPKPQSSPAKIRSAPPMVPAMTAERGLNKRPAARGPMSRTFRIRKSSMITPKWFAATEHAPKIRPIRICFALVCFLLAQTKRHSRPVISAYPATVAAIFRMLENVMCFPFRERNQNEYASL